MLNEFNKLIGREFIIGFFVPALIFIAGSAGILGQFEILPSWLHIDLNDPLKDTTFIAIVTTTTALFLMAANRIVFRTLEGYWLFDLGSRLNHVQRWRYRRLHSQITELTNERDICRKQNKEFAGRRERNRLVRIAAQRYPSKEELVLFTAFGNTVRAFEDYPRVMYGFESINGWSRLNAVMPKSYRDLLGNMRATTDCWVNLWFVSLLIIGEYSYICWHAGRGLVYPWIPLAGILIALLSSMQARSAVEQWGEWVKAGFDVYLPVLSEKMGFKRADSMESERQFWRKLSQGIVFRDAPSFDQLDSLRAPPFQPEEAGNAGKPEESEESDN